MFDKELSSEISRAVEIFGPNILQALEHSFLLGVQLAGQAIAAGQDNAQRSFDLGVKLTGVKIATAFDNGFNLDVRTNNEN